MAANAVRASTPTPGWLLAVAQRFAQRVPKLVNPVRSGRARLSVIFFNALKLKSFVVADAKWSEEVKQG